MAKDAHNVEERFVRSESTLASPIVELPDDEESPVSPPSSGNGVRVGAKAKKVSFSESPALCADSVKYQPHGTACMPSSSVISDCARSNGAGFAISPAAPQAMPSAMKKTVVASVPPQTDQSGVATPPAVDADSHLPRSGSSAMPDPTSANVPRLKARVHQRLSAADCAQIPLAAITLRPLRQDDMEEMIALHTEWFPVSYDDAFYQKSVNGELFSLVACYSRASSSSSAASPSYAASGPADPNSSTCDDVLGIITMSTACEHHGDDIMPVMGASCETLCGQGHCGSIVDQNKLEAGVRGLSYAGGAALATQTGCLAYILTLGVVDGFRRRGLARELLKRMIHHVDQYMLHIRALYLHVVTYNVAAIKLYEAMRFNRIQHFPKFYLLHGQHYDSYLYALYLHGGRPPWKWRRLWQYMGIGSLREWVFCTFSSLWRLALKPQPLNDENRALTHANPGEQPQQGAREPTGDTCSSDAV